MQYYLILNSNKVSITSVMNDVSTFFEWGGGDGGICPGVYIPVFQVMLRLNLLSELLM